jgi:branched-chain amino acid transport system permease protein
LSNFLLSLSSPKLIKKLWVLFAAVLLLAPWVFGSSLAHSVLSQIGIAIIVCLSYNLLFGQGGMLSFGHAVYFGAGAFAVIHALNVINQQQLPVPVSALPLFGALIGGALAALLGYATTKKAGMPFAMITLGVGELVYAVSLMLPGVFGGDAGVSANRVTRFQPWGITLGPSVQLYYLVALYALVCTTFLYVLTRTPFGLMLNAVRENSERVEFVGYSTRHLRWMAFVIAGFFAGMAGGLAALHFEIISSEVFRADRSAAYLLFVYLGGATYFVGAMLGAVLMVLTTVLLSEFTKAWLLYLGLAFMSMVMYMPGGLASLLVQVWQVLAAGHVRKIFKSCLLLVLASALCLGGLAVMVEMLYHLQLRAALGDELQFLGMRLNAQRFSSWGVALSLSVVGAAWFAALRRRFQADWRDVQVLMQKKVAV